MWKGKKRKQEEQTNVYIRKHVEKPKEQSSPQVLQLQSKTKRERKNKKLKSEHVERPLIQQAEEHANFYIGKYVGKPEPTSEEGNKRSEEQTNFYIVDKPKPKGKKRKQTSEEQTTQIGDVVNLSDLLFTNTRDYLIKYKDNQVVKDEQLAGHSKAIEGTIAENGAKNSTAVEIVYGADRIKPFKVNRTRITFSSKVCQIISATIRALSVHSNLKDTSYRRNKNSRIDKKMRLNPLSNFPEANNRIRLNKIGIFPETYNRMRLNKMGIVPEAKGLMVTANLRMFTLAELGSATRGFSPDMMLGEGNYGRLLPYSFSIFEKWHQLALQMEAKHLISSPNKLLAYEHSWVHSGAVASAREALLEALFSGLPSMSISLNWKKNESQESDLKDAVYVCLPLINAAMSEIGKGKFPKKCSLNVDVPTSPLNKKGEIGAEDVVWDADGDGMEMEIGAIVPASEACMACNMSLSCRNQNLRSRIPSGVSDSAGHGSDSSTYPSSCMKSLIMTSSLIVELKKLISCLNDKQKVVYEKIIGAVSKGEGGIFFLYGYRGTGKTFIWRTLTAAIRSQAMDRTCRDVLRSSNSRNLEQPFGGMLIVFGCDFQQILPVVLKGRRQDIISATIN
ncbi:hypothetical protein POM88_038327 [Heracleum sosnowskyi]|uniref:ATP-dependent DNA helicase n=1 Tax=Heracleum sosnowskyi TaxID=360622 RepID=A0AAD8H9D5_9APIA|nr:hypothetical protein POM88_038327 [Heracleum sosnowskyi]